MDDLRQGGGIIYEGKIKLFIYEGWRQGNNRETSQERDKYAQEVKMRGYWHKDDLSREKSRGSKGLRGSRRK